MADLINGITVTLYERTQTGVDAFNKPTYKENPVDVDDVLVCPSAHSDIINSIQLEGKNLAYELSIPKGDTHTWEDCRIDFFGEKWKAYGPTYTYIEDMVPLRWNKKVLVERYE